MTEFLDKFKSVATACQELANAGVDPFNVVIEEILSATEAIIEGRPVLLAGTNNYLGLTFNDQCIKAAQDALAKEGTGTTGSRMANGTFAGHRDLEREIAEYFGCSQAIIFSTGFVANLGMISTLTGSRDVIVLDSDCHASIYDACRMSDAETIRFRHNNLDNLRAKLDRLGERAANALIIVEGIYSMLGDRAPLAEIVALKKEYNSWLLVDEAHSLGVLGERGRGLAEEAGVGQDVDFIVGTFSKSLGNTGGFCVSNHPELDLIRYICRSYVFTASPSPPTVASVRVALRLIASHPELRIKLWENADRLYQGLKKLGFTLGPEPSPIAAIYLASRETAVGLWKALLEHGIYVNLVFPPAAPAGYCLLRCSVGAAHSTEQIDHILNVLSELKPVVAGSA